MIVLSNFVHERRGSANLRTFGASVGRPILNDPNTFIHARLFAMNIPIIKFTASTTHGAGRGKRIGTPTINIKLKDVPKGISHGIYACYATIEDKKYPAVAHYGPRPVFKDSETFEVHLLDTSIEYFPEQLTIELIQFLRNVQNFPSTQALLEAIQNDILAAKSVFQSL